MITFTLDNNETILLAATGLFFLIQIYFYTQLYLRIPRHKKDVEHGKIIFTDNCPPLSVILYAHESFEQIQTSLPAILQQDYPQFEVIVVTDGTDDGTSDYLTQLRANHPHLHHSFIPDSSRYISHKKLALTLGIKAARYDWIVMTETNCYPASDQWLRLLARNLTPGTEIVLGYSNYEQSKSWFHKYYIAYDNLLQAMRYLGSALKGSPYMGIGRNLLYNKKMFYKNKGFSKYLNLLRGDDDLFINQVAKKKNTRVETDTRAIVHHLPLVQTKEWREEKIGYTSTARLYKGLQRYIIGFETTTRLLFHACWGYTATIAIILHHWPTMSIAITFFLVRWMLQIYVINKNAQAISDSQSYYFTLPLFDVLQPIQSFRWKLHCLLRRKSEFMRK